jgi:hypothetical protein
MDARGGGVRIDLLGWDFILFVGVFVPFLAIRSGQRLRSGMRFRAGCAISSRRSCCRSWSALFALWTARRNGIELFPPFVRAPARYPDRGSGLGAGDRERAVALAIDVSGATFASGFLIPQKSHERVLLWILTFLAGVGESWRTAASCSRSCGG